MQEQLSELYGRLALCDAVIAMMQASDDERAPDAFAHYQGQREELVRRIQACNPPPVVVQVQVGHLSAKGRQAG